MHRRAFLGAGVALAAARALHVPRAAAADYPWPYRAGARWEYTVKAPVLGSVGKVVRTMLAEGEMRIEADLEIGGSRSGTYLYRLVPAAGVLDLTAARFTPKGASEAAWAIEIAPGLPLFPTSECPRPIDRVVRLAVTEGARVRQAQARIHTLARDVSANGYGGLHHVGIDGDDLGRFPDRAEYWVSDDAGVVRAKVGVGPALAATWDLVSFRPAP